MFWILQGLCNGTVFWKNNVRSGCRPGLEISLLTSCAFQCQGTSILGQCIHLLSLSLPLCWNSFSVTFNGDPKDLRATSLAQGCFPFPITSSSAFLWLGVALPSQATDFLSLMRQNGCHIGLGHCYYNQDWGRAFVSPFQKWRRRQPVLFLCLSLGAGFPALWSWPQSRRQKRI